MKRREFIFKSTFAGLALTSAAPLLEINIADAAANPEVEDPTSVMHYDFTKNPGAIAKDLSGHGNDGKITNAKWIANDNGQPGALRFDASSWVDCGKGDPVRVNGDMTMEMGIRLNKPITEQKLGQIFLGIVGFQFAESQYSTLAFYYNNADDKREMMVEPVDNRILSDKWKHIAVVVAYPRMRFYCDGELIRDAYMPFPGIDGSRQFKKTIGGETGGTLEMDLKDFRLYQRALTLPEINANAQNKSIAMPVSRDLAVEPNWYKNTIDVRLTSRNKDDAGRTVEISLRKPNGTVILPMQQLKLSDVSMNGSGRYCATATLPFSETIHGQSLKAVAQISGINAAVENAFTLKKPDWIHTKDGHSEKVLSPWTPVTTNVQHDKISVGIWGRNYDFGPAPFLRQVKTKEVEILTAPMTLNGQIGGKNIEWNNGKTALGDASQKAATVVQSYQSNGAALHISANTEFDGYTIYDCEIKATQDIDINNLKLDIPLKSQYATLCYGDRVLPEKNKDLYTEWYSGAVKGDLSFQFSPNIWLGNEDLGLTWQAESDQYWHNADPQKAIQILPQGKSTFFRANFIDTPTHLAAGQTLHYKFALLATPIKPLKRDGWSWRIAVNEPQGADLNLPDRKTNGEPTLPYYHQIGIRNLFTNSSDIWPWPMPVHQKYIDALHRMIGTAHNAGVKVHPYLIHQRVPVVVPEFNIYGLDMANRPLKQYVESTAQPDLPRSGVVAIKYGANSQGCVFMCPNSLALQDAYIHSLAQRLKIFGDDGVYLDGTVHIGPLCENLEHGDGYHDAEGKIHGTYATFGVRKFMQRIYTVVKEHNPDDIVDVHCSWGWNPAGLAYADVQWNGEQFGPKYHYKGVPDGYIPSALSLAQFRTEFTGRQIGIGAEMLTYRLGKPNLCAAISLLHDISPRLYTNSFDNFSRASDSYYSQVPKIWKMRDEFDADEAQKYFYYNNQDYVKVGEEDCYATLLKNPKTGLLCLVSNLSRDHQDVKIQLDLHSLGLAGHPLKAFNPLTKKALQIADNGQITIPLDSMQWMYIWVKLAEN